MTTMVVKAVSTTMLTPPPAAMAIVELLLVLRVGPDMEAGVVPASAEVAAVGAGVSRGVTEESLTDLIGKAGINECTPDSFRVSRRDTAGASGIVPVCNLFARVCDDPLCFILLQKKAGVLRKNVLGVREPALVSAYQR